MIEIIEHALGLCGESHPNLLVIIPIVGYVIYKIRKHGFIV
tara:strand:+ start:11529 stop:11651 length:123 start_codon:yes stop_codon:yes gene_type:complete